MLDLRRLRFLHELTARGTLAAVADALGYSASAVSQQLAVLEREAGVALLEPAGRGVRLTDAGRVLAAHAGILLERAAVAEAELAAAAGAPAGRGRIAAFQSVAVRIALPAMGLLAARAPALRTELVDGEPETSLPALAAGDVDLVLGDEWQHQPRPRLEALDRVDLLRDPVHVVVPARHPLAGSDRIALGALAGEPFAAGPATAGYAQMVERVCRELGGFEPDIRHRTNDPTVLLEAVAQGAAVTLLPALVAPERHPGVAVRPAAEADLARTVFAATRAVDRARPSVAALVDAVREATAALA